MPPFSVQELIVQREDELRALENLMTRMKRAEESVSDLEHENDRLRSIIREWNEYYYERTRNDVVYSNSKSYIHLREVDSNSLLGGDIEESQDDKNERRIRQKRE